VTAYDIDPTTATAITVNAWADGIAVRAVTADILGEDGFEVDVSLTADAFHQRELAGWVGDAVAWRGRVACVEEACLGAGSAVASRHRAAGSAPGGAAARFSLSPRAGACRGSALPRCG
jgi:predicted nicotinamide N-methyase